MDITSDMLDVDHTGAGIEGWNDEDGGGDELNKRVEKFGFPVGKGRFMSALFNYSIKV